jgi:pimeloyl-ACP methyl ester carboxylesterase
MHETGLLPVELDFTLDVDGRTVPATAWLPFREITEPLPLVLIGHGGTLGGTGSRRAPSQVSLATTLAGVHGIAAVAIDMPGAGDRPEAAAEAKRREGMTVEEALRDLWTEDSIAKTIADWQAVVAYLQDDVVGDAPLGYFGLSGGTMFGLPLVAQDPRIVVAVLGLNGAVPLMMQHAPDVRCRVLYVHNLDDQFGATTTGLDLFGALGTDDKRFHAFPGGHGAIPADEHEYIAAFLASGVSP